MNLIKAIKICKKYRDTPINSSQDAYGFWNYYMFNDDIGTLYYSTNSWIHKNYPLIHFILTKLKQI